MKQGKRYGKMIHGVGAPEWSLKKFESAKIERDGNLFIIRGNDEGFEPKWFLTYVEAKEYLKWLRK